MKSNKFRFIINNQLKRYGLYAFGEIFLIVIGILVAMYINNQNQKRLYRNKIDHNYLRVYAELETNIKRSRKGVENLFYKDSLIHLVMNDMATREDYLSEIYFSYLTIHYFNLNLEDRAFQSLLNQVTDENYHDDLLIRLKELYRQKGTIEDADDRMASFVYENSLQVLAKKIPSFGDLTYNSIVREDALDFFLHSNEYKSLVSNYSIISTKNQLRYNQNFLTAAYKVYSEIGTKYNLSDNIRFNDLPNDYLGTYTRADSSLTLDVSGSPDSLYIETANLSRVALIPVNHNLFFTNNRAGKYMVRFYSDSLNDKWHVNAYFLNNWILLQK